MCVEVGSLQEDRTRTSTSRPGTSKSTSTTTHMRSGVCRTGGSRQEAGDKQPVSPSYDLISPSLYQTFAEATKDAVTRPITNNYATDTVTLHRRGIIPTVSLFVIFCCEILMTMSRADPWGEFTFQKGFLWAQIVARHGGELCRCPDQFPSVISTVGDGRAGDGGGKQWHT